MEEACVSILDLPDHREKRWKGLPLKILWLRDVKVTPFVTFILSHLTAAIPPPSVRSNATMASVFLISGAAVPVEGPVKTLADARCLGAEALGLEDSEVLEAITGGSEPLGATDTVTLVLQDDPALAPLMTQLRQDPSFNGQVLGPFSKEQLPAGLPACLGRRWPELVRLYFCSNGLERLPRSLLRLHHLSVLDLSKNRLSELPDLSSLVALGELRLTFNLLRRVPVLPPRLRALFVEHNRLTHPIDLALYAHLEVLHASGNLLKVVKGTGKAARLLDLNLAGNPLREVRERASPPALQRLTLHTCRNFSEEGLLSLAPDKVTGVSLAHCNLRSLRPELWSRFSSLRDLSLVDNGLRRLPREACGCSLVRLWLSDNRLDSLPRELAQAEGLEVLDVSGNLHLSTLPRRLGKLRQLRILNVTRCPLDRLPPGCQDVASGWGRR